MSVPKTENCKISAFSGEKLCKIGVISWVSCGQKEAAKGLSSVPVSEHSQAVLGKNVIPEKKKPSEFPTWTEQTIVENSCCVLTPMWGKWVLFIWQSQFCCETICSALFCASRLCTKEKKET